MKRLMKWLLLPVLMLAVLTVALPQRADARVGVVVGYPGYYAGYRPFYAGYRPYAGYYWGPRAYWVPPVRVYRPAVVVPGPIVVPSPIVVPPYVPSYQVWE